MFKIIVAGGPCEPYIHKCISSILSQEIQDFEILISLDHYTNAFDIIADLKCDKIKMKMNCSRMGPAFNRWSASNMTHIDDEDIVVNIDADDWLTDSNSLSVVKKVYDDYPETLVTHGYWISSPTGFLGKDCQQPYTQDEFKDIRHAPWKASHLRTMKFKVLKMIQTKDLKDDNDKWFQGATDMAVMFPALEMAGYDRTKFITEPIYTYNRSGPLIGHTNSSDREKAVKIIRGRKPYELLGSNSHV
jgi:glycosyltransferase involved in cell wall biosynthesis